MKIRLLLILFLFVQFQCSSPSETREQGAKSSERIESEPIAGPGLIRSVVYNKILGLLYGSAIGDAMGAPTEMWSRQDIWVNYGFVDGLDTMVRQPSAEGIWAYNLPAGGTTDDTRWKILAGEFLLSQEGPGLDDGSFARHIVKQYEDGIAKLKATEGFDPGPYERNLREMAWLQEWAMVAKPYADGDITGYSYALNKFYGGEMTCAGMLYAPMVGAYFPGDPQLAYQETYGLSIFDLGYARDISGLTGALVSAAMAEGATQNSVLQVLRDIDPNSYFKSRLVGRSSYRVYQDAKYIVHEAKSLDRTAIEASKIELPLEAGSDTLFMAQTQRAYQLMDGKLQDMPFHPAEIHLVNLTALLFCNMDFEKSLSFIINYGRDNDTTGAVAGAILGAYWGAEKLPPEMVEQVRTANEALGIDLEALAEAFTNKILKEDNS